MKYSKKKGFINNYSFWVVFLSAKLRHKCLLAGYHIS